MDWNSKRVSVIVLCYQNTTQLKPSLQSIFDQTYPHVEIVIADDGSDGFHKERMLKWMDGRKGKNIESVQVLHHDTNQGTVQNLLGALKVITGDYYMTLGAGDVLAQKDAIAILMMYACMNRYQDLLITGKALHCDEEYHETSAILTDDDYAILKKRDAKQLFSRLIYRCCILTVATLYRRDFQEAVGGYDTDYRYYEDYPTFLRMARKGITPFFVDTVITLHVLGGIANHPESISLDICKAFHQDREWLYLHEIKPYLKGQPKDAKTQLRIRRYNLKGQYLWEVWRNSLFPQRVWLTLKHPWLMFWSLEKGKVMRTRLFRMSIACLLLVTLFRGSKLFRGPLANAVEIGLLVVVIIGCAVAMMYWACDTCIQFKKIWRKARTR